MSRRGQINMTDEEIGNYLRAAKTMTLVSNGRDGYPHPMPMWFAIDDDNAIYMTTFRKSQKVHNLTRDPKATLLVESGEQYQDLKGVVIYTEVEFLEEPDAAANIMFQVSVQRGEAEPGQRDAALTGMQKSASKRVGMKFAPTRIVSWNHQKLGGVY